MINWTGNIHKFIYLFVQFLFHFKNLSTLHIFFLINFRKKKAIAIKVFIFFFVNLRIYAAQIRVLCDSFTEPNFSIFLCIYVNVQYANKSASALYTIMQRYYLVSKFADHLFTHIKVLSNKLQPKVLLSKNEEECWSWIIWNFYKILLGRQVYICLKRIFSRSHIFFFFFIRTFISKL